MAAATDTRSTSTPQCESAQAAGEPLRQAKVLVTELRRGAGTVLASAGTWIAVHALLGAAQ